jgi:hypothetical protein
VASHIDEGRALYIREKRGELMGNYREFRPLAGLMFTGEVGKCRPSVHD